MRTTVTLDDDTERLVRERMIASGVSFKQALNDAIRAGAEPATEAGPSYRLTPRDLGIPRVDLTKALALAGELEDEELVRKMAMGR